MSGVREEGQVLVAEGHRHVDDTSSLRTETWRRLQRHGQITLVSCLLSGLEVTSCVSAPHHGRAGRVVQDIKIRAVGQEHFGLSVLCEDDPAGRFPLQP